MTAYAKYPTLGKQDNFIDIFKEICWNINVNFHFGPIEEISQELVNKNTAGVKKYPLIALVMPFTPQEGNGYDTTVNDFNFIIGCLVENSAQMFKDRYDRSFKQTLNPIYKSFIQMIANSGYFREVWPEKIVFDSLISSNGAKGNILPDFVDFYWIKNLHLNKIGKEPKQ